MYVTQPVSLSTSHIHLISVDADKMSEVSKYSIDMTFERPPTVVAQVSPPLIPAIKRRPHPSTSVSTFRPVSFVINSPATPTPQNHHFARPQRPYNIQNGTHGQTCMLKRKPNGFSIPFLTPYSRSPPGCPNR